MRMSWILSLQSSLAGSFEGWVEVRKNVIDHKASLCSFKCSKNSSYTVQQHTKSFFSSRNINNKMSFMIKEGEAEYVQLIHHLDTACLQGKDKTALGTLSS